MDILINTIDSNLLRNIPNWNNAPVPICMGGDPRALTFCCKPGSSLTFGYKCNRDAMLETIGLSTKNFIALKEIFSDKYDWKAPETCFGSLAYCCMRQGGCYRRDNALRRIYPTLSYSEALAKYYELKQQLADELMSSCDINIVK